MENPAFIHRRLIQFAETDMAGIVHFSAFFRFMEEAEHAFLRSIGLTVYDRSSPDGLVWPRVAAQCDYHSPATFEETLETAVRIAELGRKSATYSFAMSVGERKIATGRITAVCCRYFDEPEGRRMRAVEIPAEVAAKLTAR
ncbi:MAG TPA: thioesterase family protein [Planctomycetia bacterium]|nr:thioesterase family protein [Planctomycetia bacterium]